MFRTKRVKSNSVLEITYAYFESFLICKQIKQQLMYPHKSKTSVLYQNNVIRFTLKFINKASGRPRMLWKIFKKRYG